MKQWEGSAVFAINHLRGFRDAFRLDHVEVGLNSGSAGLGFGIGVEAAL